MRRSIFMKGKIVAHVAIAAVLTVMVSAVVVFAGESRKIATVTIPPAPELYATEPQPLTVNQCGQCHTGVFKNLKSDGGKHRFDCQRCHITFHAYNPKKGGWEALMPKCSSCHTELHGTSFSDCASCHVNPHAPKKVAMEKRLINACGGCHTSPKEQLATFPSKHSKLACQTCHTSHGYKPTCFNCHKPHHQGQELSTCKTCHSVHKPLQVAYDANVPAVTCGSCHTKVYATWQKTPSKHGKVSCATCHHTKHRFVPQCTECHGLPHKKEILDRFPKCLSCHLDVHDLPVMQSNAKQ